MSTPSLKDIATVESQKGTILFNNKNVFLLLLFFFVFFDENSFPSHTIKIQTRKISKRNQVQIYFLDAMNMRLNENERITIHGNVVCVHNIWDFGSITFLLAMCILTRNQAQMAFFSFIHYNRKKRNGVDFSISRPLKVRKSKNACCALERFLISD